MRDSTRATSAGLERARKEFGRFSSLSLMNVPLSTRSWDKRSHSSWEPSAKTTLSGVVSSATSAIQLSSSAFSVGA